MPDPKPVPPPAVIAPVAPNQTKNTVSIREGSTVVWIPGIKHDHRGNSHMTATERWHRVRRDTRIPLTSATMKGFLMEWGIRDLSEITSPQALMDMAIAAKFGDKPIALQHLRWFLTQGAGAIFNEDANLTNWLTTDANVRVTLHGVIRRKSARTGWPVSGWVRMDQNEYSLEDFQYAFGSIDVLSFVADKDAGTFHAWFLDCYEWHPDYGDVYPAADGKSHPDDERRITNAVHAACVELKEGLARDFWMQGETTIPLSIITSA